MRRTPVRRLAAERLEDRVTPAAVAALAAGTLTVLADDADARLEVLRDGADLVVRESGAEIARVAAGSVTQLAVTTGAGNDRIDVAPDVTIPADINPGTGINLIHTGGGPTVIHDNGGVNKFAPSAAPAAPPAVPASAPAVLSAAEVQLLLWTATAASSASASRTRSAPRSPATPGSSSSPWTGPWRRPAPARSSATTRPR
jgi:hypothetical protein